MKGISPWTLFLLLGCTSGHMKPSDPVRESLLAEYPRLYKCYKKSQSYIDKVSGRVSLDFTVGGDGVVIESKIYESEFIDPDLHDCLLQEVNKVKFPPVLGGGNIEVIQPITFDMVEK